MKKAILFLGGLFLFLITQAQTMHDTTLANVGQVRVSNVLLLDDGRTYRLWNTFSDEDVNGLDTEWVSKVIKYKYFGIQPIVPEQIAKNHNTQNIQHTYSADTDKIFTNVQQSAKFSGGDINKWLADNIKYPEPAKDAMIQGTVFVSIVIEKDGSVSTIKILRGVNTYLDAEAERVMSVMPKWIPAQQYGKVVREQFNLPIHFILK